MTKPVNTKDKPSPTDTPTHSNDDKGGKAVKHTADKQYHSKNPHGGDIAKKHEREEQPVEPIKNAPRKA